MRFVITLIAFSLVAGCSTETGDNSKSSSGFCSGGDAKVVELKERFANPEMSGLEEVSLIVDRNCIDPVSGIDPFTNPYRSSEGLNLRFCLPDYLGCGDNSNAYMTVFKESTKISLRNSLKIARSKELKSSNSGIDVYQQSINTDDGLVIEKNFYVDKEDRFVVSCVGENTSKKSCLLVSTNDQFNLSYYLTVRGDLNMDWGGVTEKLNDFFNISVVK